MKYFIISFFSLFLMSSCISNNIFDEQAGRLTLSIDHTGKISSLKDKTSNRDYIAQTPSYLITCSKYGADSIMLQPLAAKNIGNHQLLLTYPEGVTLTVSVVPTENYFRMELVEAEPLSEISQIKWGPYYTNMQGFIGEWFGIVRSEDCAIGIMGLEPNTDGHTNLASIAQYTDEGASLQLSSYDYTKGVFRDNTGKENKLRIAKPIPVTVVGSSVAMYASQIGYDNELNTVEKIVLEENLPYPTINGEWNKRSIEAQKFCLWSYYNEKNYDDYLKFAQEIGARILCKPGGFSKNWGHFEIDLKNFAGGESGLKNSSKKAKGIGIGTTLYTLTTFLKPLSDREPYVAPVPDERLQTWRYGTTVKRTIEKRDKEVVLKSSPNILETIKAGAKTIKIDNEIIEFKAHREEREEIVLSECKRGCFFTEKQNHQKNAPVKFMYIAGYQNFYPGTIDLSNEFSDRLFEILKNTDQEMFVTDGFESCLETGYRCYTGNLFMDYFYKKCKENKREILWTGSNFSQYTWHHQSHMSWGEGDQDKGIRGSMLDYRISRQVQLSTSLLPKKLGQFYPNLASVEDIEWLMAFATGWDSGVDFKLDLDKFKKNPNYDKIVKKLHLWAQAREEKAFTEEQKKQLRQTDREYKLSRESDGSWNLKFVKYWQSDKVKIRPSSDLPVHSKSGADILPCSIDWTWTHNPATYYEVILSDDMLHTTGVQRSEWHVEYPSYTNPDGSWYQTDSRHFQFVVRLPEDAPCAVNNIELTFDGYKILIPMILKPGEYLTMPQIVPVVCIYDKNHQLVEEKMIRGTIPFTQNGTNVNITVSCTPKVKGKNPPLIMNVRCQNGYFYPAPIK
ncbi:MAG: hypothetical protein HQ522_12965 [Bacteroidetes bacterium]|nr:hypothetical protein [Bacteroidota bacterium]